MAVILTVLPAAIKILSLSAITEIELISVSLETCFVLSFSGLTGVPLGTEALICKPFFNK